MSVGDNKGSEAIGGIMRICSDSPPRPSIHLYSRWYRKCSFNFSYDCGYEWKKNILTSSAIPSGNSCLSLDPCQEATVQSAAGQSPPPTDFREPASCCRTPQQWECTLTWGLRLILDIPLSIERAWILSQLWPNPPHLLISVSVSIFFFVHSTLLTLVSNSSTCSFVEGVEKVSESQKCQDSSSRGIMWFELHFSLLCRQTGVAVKSSVSERKTTGNDISMHLHIPH